MAQRGSWIAAESWEIMKCCDVQAEPVGEAVENGANIYEVEPVSAEPTYEEPVLEDLYQSPEPDEQNQTAGALTLPDTSQPNLFCLKPTKSK